MASEVIQNQVLTARDMCPIDRIEVRTGALIGLQDGLGVGFAEAASLIRDRFGQARFSGESYERRGSVRTPTFHFIDEQAKLTFIVQLTRRGIPQLRSVRPARV